MTKVFINGSSGTTGLRLTKRLKKRDDTEIIEIDHEFRKDPKAVKAKMEEADICFLCLPDDAARKAVKLAEGTEVRIIDASSAHRVMPGWLYGFPELGENYYMSLPEAERVAVPGCHASGFVALVYPLVRVGMLPHDYPLSCTSLTGYSGGGKEMIARYEDKSRPAEYNSPRIYGIEQDHKHLAEMKMVCTLENAPTFLPIVSDYYSGMLVSVPLQTSQLTDKPTKGDIIEVLKKQYAKVGLVRYMEGEPEKFLDAGKMTGRDDMAVFVTGNDDRVVLNAWFDNLGKGASGAAIECYNLMTGKSFNEGLVCSKECLM